MVESDRIAVLEASIETLQAQQDDLQERLVRAQLDQWKARIDDLEVQLHLGAMEADEHVSPLLAALRDRLLDARAQADDAASTTRDVASTLLSGLEKAMQDIRTAVLDAKSSIGS